jgi:aminoglycoside 3-N-acetyltransferase
VIDLSSNVFLCDDRPITAGDLCDKLGVHIEPDSDLYIEMDLSRFGSLHPDIKSREQLASIIISVFNEIAGGDSTIIVPSFTFSWGFNSRGVYDLNSNTHLGLIPNWLLGHEGVIRTHDPMFSVLITGKRSRWYSEPCSDSFGKCSVFAKMHATNAKLIGFGLQKFDPTFIHYVEQYVNDNVSQIKYRYKKKFTGTIIENGNESAIKKHVTLVRDLDIDYKYNFDNLISDLLDQNKIIIENVCRGKIFISDCNSVFDIAMLGMQNDLNYFRGKGVY